MGTATREHEGRYTFGKRQSDGRTPVFVDGADKPSGYVWRTERGGTPWQTEGSDTADAAYPISSPTRWQAAERIVALIDARAMMAAETERDRRPAETPEGWRVASWEEITLQGFRRVRLPRKFAYADPSIPKREHDAGPRYVVQWYADPVRVRSVSRNGRSQAEHQERFGDFLTVIAHGTGWGQTINGNHSIAVGALVPVDSPTRTVSATACPECGAVELLYASGQRTACGPCTARRLGWAVEDLPHPDHDDTAPWFEPGDAVRLSQSATDGKADVYTGTVKGWETRLDGSSVAVRGYQARRVDVRFWFDYGTNTNPAALRKIDAVEPLDPEPRHGFHIGQQAVRFDYNRDGVAFERRAFVVGFDVSPDGEPMIRLGGPNRTASPYPVGDVFHVGSHEAWCAARTERPQNV